MAAGLEQIIGPLLFASTATADTAADGERHRVRGGVTLRQPMKQRSCTAFIGRMLRTLRGAGQRRVLQLSCRRAKRG